MKVLTVNSNSTSFLCSNIALCSSYYYFYFARLLNLFVCRASAVFVGIYEPTKQKLLEIFPEKFSAVAHLVT